ncbi:disulfide oxidoreductase [Rossellomorea aquimaris]|uniref:Probable disulfide formation protein n=1 Tax=Rossellomorea aquimaris TaxID=189382 RepID=A0A366ET31_9BACI|nr:disulfide oxidoreductase [Rossellomorea aquimaris]RBP05563.1 disulfide bond formation protein DsbB [Rossellomorea aquimaris]
MKEISRSQYFLYGAWLISIIATLGSLYFSEVRGFIPCELCWFQRIAMYPLTLILGVATFQNDSGLKKIILPMSIIGGAISLLHYLEQKVEGFGGIKPCANGVPCNAEYINWFGFITIPFLALTAFILITILTMLSKNKKL